MLVVIKAILYEGAVALRASVNFRKHLRGSKPWGDVGVFLWPNGWMDQDETWHAGTQLPKRDTIPLSLGYVCCCQMAGWIKMTLGMEVGLCPGGIVRCWRPSSTPKGGTASLVLSLVCLSAELSISYSWTFQLGHSPQFSVHVYWDELMCDTAVDTSQRGVTMATNFGTKIDINAYKWISARDNQNELTYNGVFVSSSPNKTFLTARV